MSMPSPFLLNSFSYFRLLLIESAAADLKCFWPFNCKKLSLVKTKLNSAIGVDLITFAKFQNILTSAS